MKQYFRFSATANRSEYWGVHIVAFLLFCVAMMLGLVFTLGELVVPALLVYLVSIVVYAWAILATTVRRCRDAAINVWWAATTLIPYIGFVTWIVIGCLSSSTINTSKNE